MHAQIEFMKPFIQLYFYLQTYYTLDFYSLDDPYYILGVVH